MKFWQIVPILRGFLAEIQHNISEGICKDSEHIPRNSHNAHLFFSVKKYIGVDTVEFMSEPKVD